MAIYKDLIQLDAAVSKARIARGNPSAENPYSIESTIGNTVNKVLKQEATRARMWDQQMVYNQRMSMAEERRRQKERKAEIDAMPTLEQEKIPQMDLEWLTAESKAMQQQYLENLQIMDQEDDPFSEAYVQAKLANDKIMQEYQNINTTFTQLKDLSEEYIQDFNDGMISDGNSEIDMHILDTVYRKKYDRSWRQDGLIHWEFMGLDGKPMIVNEKQLPQWFDKTQKGGTQYIKMWTNFTSAAQRGEKYNAMKVEQQMRNLFSQVGDEGLKSLAYDDIAQTGQRFIDWYDDQVVKGNKTFMDWRDPKNIDVLKNELTEYYSGVIKSGMDAENVSYNQRVNSQYAYIGQAAEVLNEYDLSGKLLTLLSTPNEMELNSIAGWIEQNISGPGIELAQGKDPDTGEVTILFKASGYKQPLVLTSAILSDPTFYSKLAEMIASKKLFRNK